MTMPSDVKSVVIQFDNFRSQSGSGQHNIVEFKNSQGNYWRLEDMNYNDSTTQRQTRASYNNIPLYSFAAYVNYFDQRSPLFNLGLGTFKTTLTLTPGMAQWRFLDPSGNVVTSNIALSADFKISELQTASMAAYTTTGGPTWMDNISVQCLR